MSSNPTRGSLTWGYIRCSTNKQEFSPETQRHNIAAYVATRKLMAEAAGKTPLPPYAKEFVDALDDAQSGKVPLAHRKAGAELLATAMAGDHVIVTKLDRLGRNALDILNSVHTLDQRGVTLHILNFEGESIDTRGFMGKMLMHFLALFAEWERNTIAERAREGLANRQRKGLPKNGCAPLGMRLETIYRGCKSKKEQRLVPDESVRMLMREVISLHDESGWDFAKIADFLTARKLNLAVDSRDYHSKMRLRNQPGAVPISRVRRLYQFGQRYAAGWDPAAELAAKARQ